VGWAWITPYPEAKRRLIGVYGSLNPNNGAAPGTLEYVRNNYLVTQGTEVNPVDKWNLKGDHTLDRNDRADLMALTDSSREVEQ